MMTIMVPEPPRTDRRNPGGFAPLLLVICMGYGARFWLPSSAKSRNIDLLPASDIAAFIRHPTGDGRDTPGSSAS